MANNPMLAALNGGRMSGLLAQIAPAKQALNMIRSAGNPEAMMQQMLQGHPAYPQIQALIQQNGGDAQKAFYSLANQMGVDPNEVINALR